MDDQSAFESNNAVKLVDIQRDALYNYNADEQKKINSARPW